MLEIKDLVVEIEGKPILKELSLTLKAGEIHAVMGPNGSGKSTLSKVIAGHPDYEIKSGDIRFEGESIIDLDPEERALKGIFLAFQYPVELPGVNNESFLRMAYNAKQKYLGKEEVDSLDFDELIQEKMTLMKANTKLLERAVNAGFSGGEKKRNEILQLALLEPKLAILDETDSGLDIDALKDVSAAVNALRSSGRTFLMITHYQRLLNFIVPDVVHVFADGRIVKTGNKDLALELEERGYDWVKETVG